MHEQHILHRVVFFLAALTVRLFTRVLGADDAPLRPVMGTRGEAGAVAGRGPPGTGASSSGAPTVVASASEPPSRGARALRERAGASPRVRRVARRTGSRTWIHGLALRWPMPNRRPCTTWRLYVFT